MPGYLLKSIVFSCAIQLNQAPWLYKDEGNNFFGPICRYEPAKGSWAICIRDNIFELLGSPASTNHDHHHHHHELIDYMNSACKNLCDEFTLNDIEETCSNASQYLVDKEKYDNYWRWPISLDSEQRHSQFQMLKIYYENISASNSASIYLFVYVGLVIIAGVILGTTTVRLKLISAPQISYIRGRWTLPALFQKHAENSTILDGLIPTRLELCLILGYILAHITATSMNYKINDSSASEPVYLQKMRNLSDRLGILSFAQLPLIILFSGRNSFVENFSGLRYTTSIVLHKWISRVMLTDALCHAYLYVWRAKISNTLEELNHEEFWIFGIHALWMGILLVLTSIGWIRRRYYETFLIVHIILAIAFFRFLWVHVYRFGWTQWIWWSCILWILEKVVRIIRIINFGGIITAQATIVGGDIIRLHIPKLQTAKNWKPGQYGFLYILLPSTFWQSHPFTVMDLGSQLMIVIKAKKGATLKLLSYLKKQELGEVNIMLEGPYGESCELPQYDSQLLLCGGSGIPGPLSYALKFNLPHTLLIIVCRDFNLLEAFKPQIQEALRFSNVRIHITRKELGYASTNEHGMPVEYKRPDIAALVESIATYDGSLAVMTCGPPIFVDRARYVVAKYLREWPQKTIEYVEEYQTCASGPRQSGVKYLCASCASQVSLSKGEPVRCKECGHRVLYKERSRRVIQFEAR